MCVCLDRGTKRYHTLHDVLIHVHLNRDCSFGFVIVQSAHHLHGFCLFVAISLSDYNCPYVVLVNVCLNWHLEWEAVRK